VALRYDTLQQNNIMVLNPGWISEGIYGIINWGKEKKETFHFHRGLS
jgi:hypothetical protein